MENKNSISGNIQLSQLIQTDDPAVVLNEVQKIFKKHHSTASFTPIKESFHLIKKLFNGKFHGYRACNTEYHNFKHTLDAFLATARLLDGGFTHHPVSSTLCTNLFLSALFHDTGYIQENWDTEGTGAKYTLNHIERSIGFIQKNYHSFHIPYEDVQTICRLIRCTGLNVDLDKIEFISEDERYAGCILGTADILGQMSDRTYLEKLIFLYKEFREAGIPGFTTEFDILRKTIDFYEIVLQRLQGPYGAVYRNAQQHFYHRFGIDENLYMSAIERHIAYLRKIIEDDTTNFRHKLKRGRWLQDVKFSDVH
ncbi:MAG: hypothetical protein N2316_05620 [Spirochaetes bacterium]|nr:hypothetical protein [Spirochaetota bacterium]